PHAIQAIGGTAANQPVGREEIQHQLPRRNSHGDSSVSIYAASRWTPASLARGSAYQRAGRPLDGLVAAVLDVLLLAVQRQRAHRREVVEGEQTGIVGSREVGVLV